MEVEHRGFDQVGHRVGYVLGGGHEIGSGQAFGPEAFVDVEVKHPRHGLGHPIERAGEDAHDLRHRLDREAELQGGVGHLHDPEVLLVHEGLVP